MFTVTATDPQTGARRGSLETAHGTVETPVFMPVATKGTVKMLPLSNLQELNVQMFIANAFLLSLKPGTDTLREAGGLHGFMGWDRAIFTDSGGFQMLRRDFLQKVTDEGVQLKSPFDGQSRIYTPEKVVEIQSAIGSDVAMILDDVPPYGITREETVASMERTLNWARRAAAAIADLRENGAVDDEPILTPQQAFFAITQGGFYPDLREKCTREMVDTTMKDTGKADTGMTDGMGSIFDGFGIGGLCIGEPKDVMYRMLDATMPYLPESKPRYLMGVGSPADIVKCVARGVDIFDSVFPTRNARHGAFFVSSASSESDSCTGTYAAGERVNLRARHANDFNPLDENCGCPVCKIHTRAYLYHLRKSREYIWKSMLTVHNIWYMMELMREIRSAIEKGEFIDRKRRVR